MSLISTFMFFKLVFQSTRMGIHGLFIHFVDFHHSGVYECVAMSTITQSSISTKLMVLGKYNSITYNSKVVLYNINLNIFILCTRHNKD